MSLRVSPILVAAAAIAFSVGVAQAVARPAGEILLNRESKELSGWFSARGEWQLYPDKISRPYNPYIVNESAKCVSIVNGTGLPRSSVKRLHGKRVVVTGYAMDYDKLADPDDPAAKLLSKKVFGEDVVENFCLRQYVFVATSLRAQKR